MLTPEDITRLTTINQYWFDHLNPSDWFEQSDDIDQDIRAKFLEYYTYFKSLNLIEFDLTGEQILAAIILFDQMPRNMFRDSAQAFQTDDLAKELSMMALANRHDLAMTDIEKSFVYIPLEHSENMNDQELCVSLFQQRTKLTEQTDYAVRHLRIISQFGRFPHRNKVLGRTSTPEEEDFLASGGETFGRSNE